jgi:hypothetical protein
MGHIKWHHAICRLLGVALDAVSMTDYVVNMISLSPRSVGALERQVESIGAGYTWIDRSVVVHATERVIKRAKRRS